MLPPYVVVPLVTVIIDPSGLPTASDSDERCSVAPRALRYATRSARRAATNAELACSALFGEMLEAEPTPKARQVAAATNTGNQISQRLRNAITAKVPRSQS